ncbi:MAG: hypothetical protein ACFFFH_21215 [Candidatus Thorarchaeota archaeon]
MTQKKTKLRGFSTYKGKKQTPRPRCVLLDFGCDDPTLIYQLKKSGSKVERVWHHAADPLNYEIIEICTTQYIDILVSTNRKLLTPPEEWLTYLLPHHTSLFFPPPQLLQAPEVLPHNIYNHSFTRFQRKNKQLYSHQLQYKAIKRIKKTGGILLL